MKSKKGKIKKKIAQNAVVDKKQKINALAPIIAAIATCFVIVLIFGVARVHGPSMDVTLHDGEIVFIQKELTRFKRGDILVAKINKKTTGERIVIIKRVIGVPGDKISIKDNKVVLNGQELAEEYIKEPMEALDMDEITLGENDYFLMGDNRNNSYDSRLHGVIKKHEIRGKVLFGF